MSHDVGDVYILQQDCVPITRVNSSSFSFLFFLELESLSACLDGFRNFLAVVYEVIL